MPILKVQLATCLALTDGAGGSMLIMNWAGATPHWGVTHRLRQRTTKKNKLRIASDAGAGEKGHTELSRAYEELGMLFLRSAAV